MPSRQARSACCGSRAEHLDPAGVALDVALEHLERGGLARAVRAEQRDAVALLDVEADALDGAGGAIALVQVVDDDRGHLALPFGSRGGRSHRRYVPGVGSVCTPPVDTCPYRNMFAGWPDPPPPRMSSTRSPRRTVARSSIRWSRARRRSGRSWATVDATTSGLQAPAGAQRGGSRQRAVPRAVTGCIASSPRGCARSTTGWPSTSRRGTREWTGWRTTSRSSNGKESDSDTSSSRVGGHRVPERPRDRLHARVRCADRSSSSTS